MKQATETVNRALTAILAELGPEAQRFEHDGPPCGDSQRIALHALVAIEAAEAQAEEARQMLAILRVIAQGTANDKARAAVSAREILARNGVALAK